MRLTSSSSNEKRIDLIWQNADMSGDDATTPVARPAGTTKATVFISWTAPGGEEPVGTIVFHGLESVSASDSFTIPSTHSSPAGSAASQAVELYMYGAGALKVAYTRSGGGDGAVCTASVIWS